MFAKIFKKFRELGPTGTMHWLWSGIKLRYAQKIRRRKLDFSGKSKNKRQIFIFAAVPFYDVGGGQRSAQLARTFARLGFAVHYIYVAPSAESKVHTMKIPAITHRFLGDYRLTDFINSIRTSDIAIFELPRKDLIPYLLETNRKKAKIIYENIDNWEAVLGKSFFDKQTAQKFIKIADVSVGTAQPLVGQLISYGANKNKVIYAPNAVNDTLFNVKRKYVEPKDLMRGKKTLLYYGTLDGEWFDWDLVWGVAKKLPDYAINLIGDHKNISGLVKSAPANVHFLGPKKQTELPAYLQHSDVAILPFLIDETVRFVSPLKIFEYIAMDKATISTRLPDLSKYPNVWIGDNLEEWTKLLKNYLRINKKAAKDFVEKNTWSARAEQLIRAVDSKSHKP